jgi:hypothetical protein
VRHLPKPWRPLPAVRQALQQRHDGVDAWTDEADAVVLNRIDEVDARPRPTAIGDSYAEREYEALSAEQPEAWAADGVEAALPHDVQARGQATPTAAALFVLGTHANEVRAARADYEQAQRVLGPEARREPGAKLRYWLVWMSLAVGDSAGVLAAAVMLGEIPWVAAGQALSSGLAAACAGLVGSELKHRQLAQARRRDPETLTSDEQSYRRFFSGTRPGIGTIVLICALSLLVVILMMLAVFALRTSVEGTAAGVTFGLLAAVTALGSALLSYASADDVADLLATKAKRIRKAEQHHRVLAQASAIRVHAEADAAASAIRAEYQHRGRAAAKRVESLSWRIMRRNPQVFGHGFPNGEQGGVIGRRVRRGDDE